jgi:hypothetical protein
MSRPTFALTIMVILLLIAAAGCISPTNKPSTPSSVNPAVIPGSSGQPGSEGSNSEPSVQTGSLMITSTPFGADVYLNDTYAGNTTLIVNNLTAGSVVRISLRSQGYATYNGTATIVANQTAKFPGALTVAKSSIQFNNLIAKQTSPCYFDITGTISNTGDTAAQGVLLTLTLDPGVPVDQKLGYVQYKFIQTINTMNPGSSIPVGFSNIHIPCGGQYKATVEYKGEELDPFSGKSTAISGSAAVS